MRSVGHGKTLETSCRLRQDVPASVDALHQNVLSPEESPSARKDKQAKPYLKHNELGHSDPPLHP